MSKEVRLYEGTPPVSAFANDSGTPLVLDTTTGTLYYLAAGDVVTALSGGGGGGGVTDHGLLTGLADDDHTQYFNTTRGDARYSQTTHLHTGTYDPAGTAAAAIVTHVGLSDPHTQYLLESALDSGVVTITVPYPGAYEWTETVTATGVTSSQRVLMSIGSHVDADENSAELLDVAAIEALAGTDQITVTASFSTLTQGAIKLNYMAI